jgi:hypothetical protein
VLLSGEKERQGDFVYTTQSIGEHSHCIFNTMASYAAKSVDIELTAQDDKFSVNAKLPQNKGGLSDEHLSPLEESLYKLSADLSHISRNQKYFRTRENRNFATVKSTESRIFWFSLMENMLIVAMSALQVIDFFDDGWFLIFNTRYLWCASSSRPTRREFKQQYHHQQHDTADSLKKNNKKLSYFFLFHGFIFIILSYHPLEPQRDRTMGPI